MHAAALTGPDHPVKTHLPDHLRTVPTRGPLSNFLGLFSVGLGLWELIDPRGVARRTGVPYPDLIRAYGLRELAAGVGILASDRPAGWLWARVAGYESGDDRGRANARLAAAAVAGVTALDLVAAGTHAATD